MMSNNPVPNYAGAYPPPVLIKPSSTRRAIKWVLGIFGLMFALLLGLLVLLLIAAETGPLALLAGMIFAMLPVPIYIMLILWIDRYESEPLWMLATAFFWGAIVAVFAAYILNTVGEAFVYLATRDITLARFTGAVILAPTVEESFKALVLFILFFWKKDEFDGIVDGIVYAGMVGLGFAMTENFAYYGRAIVQSGIGGAEFTMTYLIRGALAPFSHPLFTSMTGIGLGWSRQSNNKAIKFIAPLIGFGLAMLMHASWNFFASISASLLQFLVLYFVFMVPAFTATLIVIFFGLRREGRIVREHLLGDFQRGLLTQEEYNRLGTVRGRMGASYRALTKGGFGVWRTRMQFNQMASELAFHRSRVARGFFSNPQSAAEREAAYVQLLQDLRQRLGSH
jgi:RsiW-degrading membrane proteinase PrsW (M82 family)